MYSISLIIMMRPRNGSKRMRKLEEKSAMYIGHEAALIILSLNKGKMKAFIITAPLVNRVR